MNNSKKIAAIVLAAGKGTRMNSDLPKAMMPLNGQPMIRHILNTLEDLGVDKIITVISHDGKMIAKEVAPYETAIQEKQLGTGHAVLSARKNLCGFEGDIMVVYADHPIITKETFANAIRARREGGYAVVVLGFRPQDPLRYGRLMVEGEALKEIVEYKDATDEQRKVNLCNSGVMCFDSSSMLEILGMISNENAAGEYYLTDAVSIANRLGMKCGVVECSPEEVAGANTREELAQLEKYLQARKG